ncbi:hypothetical protein GKZ90_0013760 [Flavobacterium sp. MC2016-06]|jgi:hypothetical protein|uniref:hypothetical protein n=1 Tax=Flavobacterium sp. MC2016-06 TaxID=2676308 RepID=UPI0012BAD524|nr:hypothetical protein [Flavobacterium sp. MC2016-06]MBU3861767.1 hypothetical protein [Flavobacterium sp. MC2016-06]
MHHTHCRLLIILVTLLISEFVHSQENTELKVDTLVAKSEKPKLAINGSFRVHYKDEFYNETRKNEGGEFGFDLFNLVVSGSYKNFKVFADMRFMPPSSGGTMPKEGWIGYDFQNGDDIQVGLVQDPFGNLDYNSYSWFLGIGYALGFEGKYSMGAKYHHKGNTWDWQAAFMKNAMESFTNDPDLRDNQWSASVLGDNKEINQLSGQLLYKVKTNNFSHKIGVSGQFGQLYNFVEDKMGSRNAFAVHYNMDYKSLGIKAEVYKYEFNPKGMNSEYVDIGSFNYTYQVVSKGDVYALSAKYGIPFKGKSLNEITFYSEYGYLGKKYNLKGSQMLTNGVLIQVLDQIYTYVEYVAGYNHPFLGDNQASLYNDYSNKWHARLQCNIGYYF